MQSVMGVMANSGIGIKLPVICCQFIRGRVDQHFGHNLKKSHNKCTNRLVKK